MRHPTTDLEYHVSTSELRAELEKALSQYFGPQCVITRIERRPSAYSTSFALEELDVRLSDGTILQLMFKNLSWEALLQSAQRVKPAVLYHPLREIETYRTILNPCQLGTATCYGAVVQPQAERYWLFLERVSGLELYQVGEFRLWQEAARWLATLHGRFTGAPTCFTPSQREHLLDYNADFFRSWLQRARTFSHRSKEAHAALAWLAGRYDQVVDRLVSLPITFIHGEFYAANVLVDDRDTVTRVCPVDWEMAGIGPGLLDLAALTAGAWTDEEKTALATVYHRALPATQIQRLPLSKLLPALDSCHLHISMQWLGWSPQWWDPPTEQSQNWLQEALRLADKLDL